MNKAHSGGSHTLINATRLLGSRCNTNRQFSVKGLQLTLKSLDPALVNWATRYLQPLSEDSDSADTSENPQRQAIQYCIYSDELMSQATRYLALTGITTFRCSGKNSAQFHGARLTRDHCLYHDAERGLYWLFEHSTDTVFMVYSSRSREPALEFNRTVRSTAISYLELDGWCLYHAGAVETADGIVMVVGESGAGKTSLILDLVYAGAAYVSNEILMVKKNQGGIEVLGFPMAVAIGIGSALQFPGLAALVEKPDSLVYPRHRYRKALVVSTPREERHRLDDKLQLLPDEMLEYLGNGSLSCGGLLSGLVVPCVSKSPARCSAQRMSTNAITNILDDNFMGNTRDRSHPVWRESDFRYGRREAEEQIIDLLTAVGAVELSFHLDAARERDSILTYLLGAGV